MDATHVRSAALARARIDEDTHDRRAFRAALLAVPFDARDTWVDRVLGLDEPPDDGPELPVGCVPYLPCGVEALIEIVDRAQIGPEDVFVDVGAGVGRAMALVHLLTGAAATGIEIQAPLVDAARALARTVSPRISSLHGDAAEVVGGIADGTVYFLYCPFGGERLRAVLAALEAISRARPFRVCCVDLPLPELDWLDPDPPTSGNVTIHRSRSDVNFA